MGTRIVHLSAALAASLYAAVLLAQESPAPACSGNLLQQVKWLRLEIVGGRIVARGDRCSQARYVSESVPAPDARQALTIEAASTGLALRYEQHSADSRLLLEIDERAAVTISFLPAKPDARAEVRFVQPPQGRLLLNIGGKSQRRIAADDLWQLLVAERDACRDHLLPLMETLRPQWGLSSQLDELERTLLSQDDMEPLRVWQQWQECVDELSSPAFARRQLADRALRESGQCVLAFLRQLDQSELTGEQRRRVAAMLADLPDGDVDSPPRAARWLVFDRRVWLALLARGELEQRIIAAEHLSKLCRRPLAFDPHASPQQRTAQLAELSAKLADK
jgi:hypothetical protein